MKSEFIFQSSPWFILCCLLAGISYAFILYQKKKTFSTLQNRILSIIRGLLVSLVAFLLINPLLRSNKISIEKPTVVIAIDNSSSMQNAVKNKINEKIQQIKSAIEGKGAKVEFQTLEGTLAENNINELKFNQKQSNLGGMLNNIKAEYEGRNLTDVILISDGIANAGILPTYGKYNFNIHTLGSGDTTAKKDVKINAIYANRIAYLGNKFPIQVEISNYGFAGKWATVVLKQGETIIDKQTVNFTKTDEMKQLTFYVTAKQKGIQRYVVEVLPISGEFSTKNNKQDTFIDVVDGKEKILLVALAPHPDLKALKSIIEKNELYELTIKILQSDDLNQIGSQPFDLLILHQLPDNYAFGTPVLAKLLAQGKPCFFILGNQSNIASFNGMQQSIAINSQAGRADKITASTNKNFNLFNINAAELGILEKLPPISAPFGTYNLLSGTETVLFQRIGSVITNKPLLTVNTTTQRKVAVLAAEGIWLWRAEEFSLTEKQEVLDEIILKTIQLISLKDDKRKLRVYPILPEFSIDDKIVFENEAYNNIYERIYNQPINLTIIDDKGKTSAYNYTPTKDNTKFEISGLKEGVYRYKASTQILGKAEIVEGQFIVKNTDLESQTVTADFNLLRTLSAQNNGKFFDLNQGERLNNFLTSSNSPDKVSSIEEMNEFINLKWIFFLILLLASIEWGLRKYFGTY